jgi:hypothetical protein
VAGRKIGEDETDQDSPEPMRRPTGTIPMPASGFSQAEHHTVESSWKFIPTLRNVQPWVIPDG